MEVQAELCVDPKTKVVVHLHDLRQLGPEKPSGDNKVGPVLSQNFRLKEQRFCHKVCNFSQISLDWVIYWEHWFNQTVPHHPDPDLWRLQEAVVLAVLRDVLGVEQDGPSVHQNLVRLVHRDQDVVGVLTAVTGSPAKDTSQVVT